MSGAARSGVPRRRLQTWLRRLAITAVLGGALVMVLRVYVIEIAPVRENSMWPSLRGGVDHIAVNKLARTPRRWEAWVYKRAARRSNGGGDTVERLVKRVLAVEGEYFRFVGGDLYVGSTRDDLHIAERPPELVDEMMVPVYPGFPGSEFSVRASSGPFRKRGDGLVLEAGPHRSHGTLPIRHRYLDAKGLVHEASHLMRDVRVDVRVDALIGSGPLRLGHELGRRDVRVLEIGPETVRVLEGGEAEKVLATWSHGGFPISLRMETLDRKFRVVSLDSDDGSPVDVRFEGGRDTVDLEAGAEAYSQLYLGLAAGRAEIGKLDVSRDVYYFWPLEGQRIGSWYVEADTFFLVGDNVPASADCREYGAVSRRHLIGRVIGVAWPRIHDFP